uniref:Uncharacterized protein n=1 Tax=Arundo donax TaxID=35708 RepID=A0A0A9B3H9_ARUDO
MTQPFLGQRL